MKLTMQRNTYGLGLPLRNMMDRKICSDVSVFLFTPSLLLPFPSLLFGGLCMGQGDRRDTLPRYDSNHAVRRLVCPVIE